MMNGRIDFRSDTVTWPTADMRQAMASAVVGDDVYGDDPTINDLERLAAEMLGKEAALFVPSGTMGNQLALMAQVNRGDETILSERCHIICHEAGAAAILSGAQTRCLPVINGQMDLDAIEAAIRKDPDNIHSPRTALICLENADSDGLVLNLDYMRQVRKLADQYHIPIHLDGARLFNAAAALKVSAAQIAELADTVQICLSKGLCAPVGSLLLGTSPVIERARRKRKILGGGMRQAGVLAAAGLIALREMTQRLTEDHDKARWLAEQISARPDLFELMQHPAINMIFFKMRKRSADYKIMIDELSHQNILVNSPEEGIFRIVTHYWIDWADLEKFMAVLIQLA